MGGVVESIGGVIGDAFENIGKIIGGDLLDDALGLESIGQEVERWGEDIGQVYEVAFGKYHSDMKEAERFREQVQAKSDAYNAELGALYDKMEGLVAFHEIFQMAMSNRIDRHYNTYGKELEALMEQYEGMLKRIQNEYSFVIGLTEGAFIQKIVGSLIMIHGGIMSDLSDILSGKADGETWKRTITTIVLIIVLVLMWWNPAGWGAAAGLATLSTATMVMITISTFLALDGMYAGGAAMGAVMSGLDFIFNDLLNLDDLIGKDFNKFDKDHEDYAEMAMYTKLGISLATMYVAWSTAPAQSSTSLATQGSNGATFAETLRLPSEGGIMNTITTQSTINSTSNAMTTIFGINISTYKDIYSAYEIASSVGDMVTANKAYEEAKSKFKEDMTALESALNNKYRKNFMKHYKDTAYFLQDQQEFLDRYIWNMTAQSMYVDPYGTTPVANIRFTPDDDTRVMSFGFEDMFDENKQAGSRGYFNSILYGS